MMSLPRKRSGPTPRGPRPVLVEVGNQHQHAAAAEVLGHLVQRRARLPGRVGFSPSSACSTMSMCLADGGTCSTMSSSNATGRRDRAAGARGTSGSRPASCVIELGEPAAAEAHRLRDVEQHGEVRVGIRLVLLDVVAIGPRVQSPVDAADVVARRRSRGARRNPPSAEYGERCIPLMNPSTTWRATSSRFPMRASTVGIDEPRAGDGRCRQHVLGSSWRARIREPESGSANRELRSTSPTSEPGPPRAADRSACRVVIAFRLRVEVGQHAVAQHRCASARMSSKLT